MRRGTAVASGVPTSACAVRQIPAIVHLNGNATICLQRRHTRVRRCCRVKVILLFHGRTSKLYLTMQLIHALTTFKCALHPSMGPPRVQLNESNLFLTLLSLKCQYAHNIFQLLWLLTALVDITEACCTANH